MSAFVLSVLLSLAPPDAESPPSSVPTPIDPPPPIIEGPLVEGPAELPKEQPDTVPPVVDPDGRPAGTKPPGESEGVVPVNPDDDEPASRPEPESVDWDVPERTLDSLPYAPTAARKSAVRRGNDVLVRPFNKPVYSVAAAARLGVLLGGGRQVIQPIAWGVALQIRLHFLRVVKSRFGIEIHAGHTRWQQRQDFEVVVGEAARLTRINLLTHTDVSLGPSFEIPIGPVFLQLGATGGFAVSTLSRARSADASEDDRFSEFDGLLRGGSSLGIPIANRQGLVLGVGVHYVFSKREVLIDPNSGVDGVKTGPFGLWLESFLGYSVWF